MTEGVPASNNNNSDSPSASDKRSTNPFVTGNVHASNPPSETPIPGEGNPPSIPQIEIKVLTPEEQQAQFSENISTRKVYLDWYFRTRSIAVANTVFSLVLGLLCLLYSISNQDATTFGFSILVLFHAMSSWIILFRFPKTVNRERDIRTNRETKASLLMSVLLLITGIALFVSSMDRLSSGIIPVQDGAAVVYTTLGILVSVIVGTLNIVASTKVESFTLIKASLLSFAVALTAFFISLAGLIYYYTGRLWWLDSLLVLLIGITFMCYPIRSFFTHGAQIRLLLCPPRTPVQPVGVVLSDLNKQWEKPAAPAPASMDQA